MLSQGARPRQLRWFHAGPMLFGDWGTSRLYVLGLAFFYAGQRRSGSCWRCRCCLVAVGWAYQVICRLHPDGGGVYSSARERSQTLAVIGALLLCADYIVTASLSALDAFHYVHLDNAHLWAAGAIGLIGAINYFGPTKAGRWRPGRRRADGGLQPGDRGVRAAVTAPCPDRTRRRAPARLVAAFYRASSWRFPASRPSPT